MSNWTQTVPSGAAVWMEAEEDRIKVWVEGATGMDLTYPLKRKFRVSSTFQNHLDRDPPSTAPGTDFAAPTDEPVFAIADGYVELAEARGAGGIWCWLNHGRNEGGEVVKSYYAHLSSLEVVKLQKVVRGQKIGEVGSTGNSTGPHLHLSIRVGGQWADPEPMLPEPN